MASNLGRQFNAGETIIRQGDIGDCMYVIQSGEVEVVQRAGDQEILLGTLTAGDFFGEMAVFEQEVRSATVRALNEVRVITVDKKTLYQRISGDPTLAFRMLEKMSSRLRAISVPYARMSATDRRNWVERSDAEPPQ